MVEPKTKATKESVAKFLNSIEPADKRKDALTLLKMFKDVTGEKAVMWGTSIVGFGTYHYKSEKSAQEGDWMRVAFSPRKQNLTLYLMNIKKDGAELLKKLGKHKTSTGGCLYINKLGDVDQKVLAQLIKKSFLFVKRMYK